MKVLSRVVRGHRPASVAKPQLTSLIDVLTILLVFLLKSFSVEGELVTISPDLRLPESTSRETPVPTVSVEIATHSINVDGAPVASTSGLVGADSLMIRALYDHLLDLSRITDTVGEPHEVTIHCDKAMDFGVIKRVMYTCSQADYADFSLLVLQEDQS